MRKFANTAGRQTVADQRPRAVSNMLGNHMEACRKFSQLILKERPEREVCPEHFELQQVERYSIGEGQVLLRVIYLSIEPLLRGRLMARANYAQGVMKGDLMVGRGLAIVIESRNKNFEVGDIVEGWTGWTELCASNGAGLRKVPGDHRPLPHALGILGASGLAASLSLSELGGPVAGETILVTSAAGATGSIVVQLAKQAGAFVVGIAGGPEKCRYVKETLGADAVIDYRVSDDILSAIRDSCPRKIDVFWDCVGGKISTAAFENMNAFGRIIVFGTLDFYSNPMRSNEAAWDSRPFLVNRLSLSGFLVSDHARKHEITRTRLAGLVKRGKLDARFVEYEGLESAPQALADVIAGKNLGKVVVKLFDFSES